MEDSNASIILLTFLFLINTSLISISGAEDLPGKLTVSKEDGPIYSVPTDDKPYRGIDLIFPVFSAKPKTPEYAFDSGRSDFRCIARPNHFGNDLFAPLDTVIVAPAPGRVIMAVLRPGRGPGNKIAIDHGNGVITYYLHMDRRLVKAGDWVERGEPIALVGNTGNASTTPPHLHFEIDLDVSEQRKPDWFTSYIDYMPFPGVVHLHSSDPLAYTVSKKQ